MPEINEFHNQLQAYALGCLDKTDFNNLRNYIHSGKDYSWQELGEYQNLAALLPSILNMEMPAPGIKDNVARKLYRIQDEMRARKSGDLSSLKQPAPLPVAEEQLPEEPAEETVQEEENSPELVYQTDSDLQEAEEKEIPVKEVDEYPPNPEQQPEEYRHEAEQEQEAEIPLEEKPEINSPEDEFQIVTPVRKTSEFIRSQEPERGKWDIPAEKEEDPFSESDPRNKSYAPEDKLQYIIKEEAAPVQKNSAAIYITLALLVLLIAGGVYAYLTISKEVKGYKTEVGRLNEEIKGLSSGSGVTDDLKKMLELPDTRIITLTASKLSPGGFGKVIINPMEGAGFLQLGGMPPQGYSLWLSSGRTHISLGTFKGSATVQYFRFDLPDLGQKQKFFLLTAESAPGAERPAEQIYFSGSF
jgi:hypothetical protein